jgi:hypothetical protein
MSLKDIRIFSCNTQHNDNKNNDTQHNNMKNGILSIMTLETVIRSVSNELIMLSVIVLSVVMMNVAAPKISAASNTHISFFLISEHLRLKETLHASFF